MDLAPLNVLVVNAGSTSLKLSLVDDNGHAQPLASLEEAPAAVDAVGHRVVHGGDRFHEPVLLDESMLAELDAITELAPLHNPPSLKAIEAARRALPDRPHVAVFDTAFHATLPEEAATYPLPARWRELGLRRYGFQGIAAQWAAEQVPVPRLVVCHLGGGSSVTAIRDGRSVDTTMGFTPLEGLPMATRSGSVDPGLLLHLLRHEHANVDELEHALQHESGLLGLSGGLSFHVHELEAAEAKGHEGAALALTIYARRIAQAVAAAAVALEGLDAIAFTAGAGERSPKLRARVCAQLGFLGAQLDEASNDATTSDGEIGADDSSVRVVVVVAREDLVIARAVRQMMSAAPAR